MDAWRSAHFPKALGEASQGGKYTVRPTYAGLSWQTPSPAQQTGTVLFYPGPWAILHPGNTEWKTTQPGLPGAGRGPSFSTARAQRRRANPEMGRDAVRDGFFPSPTVGIYWNIILKSKM